TPFIDELKVLVKDLDAIIATISDIEPSFGVHGQRMWLIEFTLTGAFFAKAADQLSIFGEFEDSCIGVGSGGMALGDENIPVWRNENGIRLVEVIAVGATAEFSKSHQQLAVRAEFEHLMPDRRTGLISRLRSGSTAPTATCCVCSCSACGFCSAGAVAARGARRVILTIGNPDVAVVVDEQTVRECQHSGAKTLYQFAVSIEFHD